MTAQLSPAAALVSLVQAVPPHCANELLRERVRRALPTLTDAQAFAVRRAISYWPTPYSARPLEEPFSEWVERRLVEVLGAAAQRAHLAMDDGRRLRQPEERRDQAQALADALNALNDRIRRLWRVRVDLPRWFVDEHPPSEDETELDRMFTVGASGYGCLFLYGHDDELGMHEGRCGWGPSTIALEPPEGVAAELIDDPHGLFRDHVVVPGSVEDLDALVAERRLDRQDAAHAALLVDFPGALADDESLLEIALLAPDDFLLRPPVADALADAIEEAMGCWWWETADLDGLRTRLHALLRPTAPPRLREAIRDLLSLLRSEAA